MDRPDAIELSKRQQRRRRNRWNVLIAIVGIISAVVLTMAMWFLLYHVRAHACPANSFIVGSTQLGNLLATVPWFFVGLFAGCTLTSFALERLLWARAIPAVGRSTRQNFRRWMRLANAITAGLLVLASILFYLGALTGFCAGADGIGFRKAPWSDTAFYQWEDVRRVSVACYPSGRTQHTSFTLAMSDGAAIDLYNIPRSFNGGYPSVRQALQKVPLVYDDSRVRANCYSTLRDLPPW